MPLSTPVTAAAIRADGGSVRSRASPLPRDPFATRARTLSRRFDLLGGRFHFRSTDRRLLAAVDAAYAGTPGHRLDARPPDFDLELLSQPGGIARRAVAPAPLTPFGRPGFLGGATPGGDQVLLWPQRRQGVVVAGAMLASPYHLRYEMVEFAVYALAARALSLAPLHAACVSRGAKAALLFGESGAGKSTVSLCCLLRGLEFIAEDAVFVQPATLRATGVANYLHLQRESLHWVAAADMRRRLARAPRIVRRSGVQKLEVDLRQPGFRLARRPAGVTQLLFLSRRSAGRGPLLRPLVAAEVERRLVASQPYARSQADWPAFLARALTLPACELRRGAHPDQAAAAIESLLCASR